MKQERRDEAKRQQEQLRQQREAAMRDERIQNLLNQFYDLNYFGIAGGEDGLSDLCDSMEYILGNISLPEVTAARKICSQALKDFARIMTPDYGVCNEAYVKYVQGLTERQISEPMEDIIRATKQRSSGVLEYADFSKLHDALWFYAFQKPFSADKFNRAKGVFLHYCSTCAPNEAFVAELYAKSQIGGDRAIQNDLNAFLHPQKNSPRTPMQLEKYSLEMIASALMWMGAYGAEQTVLEYTLEKGIDMGEKLTVRLHNLQNYKKGPVIHSTSGEKEKFYFSMDSIAWKDDEIDAFFAQLGFMQRDLDYALAIRNADRKTHVPDVPRAPTEKAVADEMRRYMIEELGDDIEVSYEECVGLTGAEGKEKFDGILITTKQSKNLGILVYLMQMGKLLNIKFYSLMIPAGISLDHAEQQTKSMKRETNAKLTMWENTLIEYAEKAIENALNKQPGEETIPDMDTVF